MGGGDTGRDLSTTTVLFTDLVASTETRVALGEGIADLLRRTHDRIVGQAVEAHRGRVVKGLGDGLMAVFTASADALAAAVATQRALARHNRSIATPASLVARIGISVGDVAFEEGDCFGTPVVEAARLCAAAQGGQVLASEVVRLLAGARGGHRFRSLGTLDLKGLPAPIGTVEVAWEPQGGAMVPLPPGLDHASAFGFVGREAELARLSEMWKEAADERRVVLLAGEPGIGKTRLVAELARVVHDQGAPVLYGRCDEELRVPYQPFAEALSTYLAGCPPDELADQLGPLGGELVRILPGLPERVPGLPKPLTAEVETERYRLFEAVAELIGAVGAAAPVLLALDDLHWADQPTLSLLRHLVQPGRTARLLIVGTYRDTELDRGHLLAQLLADLRREPDVERLVLRGLSREQVARLVEMAGVDLTPLAGALADAVYHETEGNAFFVGEVMRHFAESRAVLGRGGRPAAEGILTELGVPEGVREVVGRRLSRAMGAAGDVLAVAAVIGRDFDVGLLLEASGAGSDAVLDALERAEEARLVAPLSGPAERYTFSHALVRSTIYDDLPASKRARLHRRVGEALARRTGDEHVAELAHHFHAAGPAGDPTRTLEYSVRAGGQANAGLAHEQAAACYTLALEALGWAGPDGEPRRAEVLLARGEAWRRVGEPERAREDFLAAAEAARRRNDPEALARAALGVGEVSAVWGADADLVELLEAALEQLDETSAALRARLLARLGQAVFYSDAKRRLELASRAVDEARRAGDQAALAAVLRARHVVLSGPDGLSERKEVADELVRLAETVGEPELALHGHAWRMVDLLEQGGIEAVDQDLAAHAELAASLRQPLHLRDVAAWRGMRALLDGRFDEAEQRIGDARTLGEQARDSSAEMIEHLQRFFLIYERGRPDEVSAWIPVCDDDAETSRGGPSGYPWRAGGALLRTAIGESDRAHREFQALTDELNAFSRDAVWLPLLTLLAELCARFPEPHRAGHVYQVLLPYAGQLVVIDRGWVCRGAVDHYLGPLAIALGRLDEAVGHCEAALDLHQRMGAQPFLTRTRCAYAHALLQRGGTSDRARGADLASQALRSAETLGMVGVAREARGLLSGEAEPA